MGVESRIIQAMLEEVRKMKQGKSNWSFYDIGRVAENKSRSTNKIFVYLAEKTPEMRGTGKVEEVEDTVKFKDDLGNDEEVSTTHCGAIEATWLPNGDRCENAPDVRVGERVFVWRYADMEELYWTPTNLDKHLRRLETMSILFSADPDGTSDSDRDETNSYSLVISTHDKLIRFQTTALNGEPFTYTLELNTEEGYLTFIDNEKNRFVLDSKNTKIILENKDLTRIVLDKKNIDIYAPDSIKMEAVNTINVACTDLIIKASKSITEETKVMSITATDSYTVKSQKAIFDVPDTVFKGKVKVEQKVTMDAEVSVGGVSSFNGPMTAKGITSSLPIKGPDKTI